VNASIRRELLSLMETLFEGELSREQHARLEHLVISDVSCRSLYVQFIELHAHLTWDAGGAGALDEQEWNAGLRRAVDPDQRVRRLRHWSISAALVLMIGVVGWLSRDGLVPSGNPDNGRLADVEPSPGQAGILSESQAGEPVSPVRISNAGQPSSGEDSPSLAGATSGPDNRRSPSNPIAEDQVVAFINTEVRTGWEAAGLTPAPRAEETEWVRRVHLDLAGRIPTPNEVEDFLRDARPGKRERLVDSLLESGEFSRHVATVWTNLLVGRSREENFDRRQLFAWLERQFGENRSWRETVTELVTARGTPQENAPVNFLLAHMNNQAVPATAVTSRILLCEQLQCTQCHQHPSVKDWGQDRFWELNAFFQQAEVKSRFVVDQETGQRELIRELVDSPKFGPTFYENLNGVMRMAFPRFAGIEVTRSPERPLRDQLAELLFDGENPQVARAFVNRTWATLLGYGFTNPVDDMGPHTPVSHPELLDGLSAAFADNGFNVKRLVRWICLSEPYQLSGRPPQTRTADAPEEGELAYFSRVYAKPLSAEQLFDSLMIASGVSPAELHRRSRTTGDREQWLRQFFADTETEENSEMTTFDGSIPQTLVMMNGELVQRAVSPDQGLIVREILSKPGTSEGEKIRQLCLAALSRYPTDGELSAIRQALRRHVKLRTDRDVPPQVAFNEGLRDVYWAYLNSSEFLVNH